MESQILENIEDFIFTIHSLKLCEVMGRFEIFYSNIYRRDTQGYSECIKDIAYMLPTRFRKGNQLYSAC